MGIFSGAAQVDYNQLTSPPQVIAGYFPDFRDTSGRTAVDPRVTSGEPTMVYPILGQSYSGAFMNAQHTPVNAKLHNLDPWGGGVYTAVEPLLGDNYGSASYGNVHTRVGDKLITDGFATRVILYPAAIGGLSTTALVPGGVFHHRLRAMCTRIRERGYTAPFVALDIGTTDGTAGMSQGTFSANLSLIIASLITYGLTCPVILAKSSYSGGTTYSAITNAQAALWNGTTILQGPDLDSIIAGSRYDGSHYNSTGAVTARDLWITKIEAWLTLHPIT